MAADAPRRPFFIGPDSGDPLEFAGLTIKVLRHQLTAARESISPGIKAYILIIFHETQERSRKRLRKRSS